MKNVVIAGVTHTPTAGFQGDFATLSAPDLGGAIKHAQSSSNLTPDKIDEIIMGCVLLAGLGLESARQAGFIAGCSEAVLGTTINKMCGFGMQAMMMAADQITLGRAQFVVAGGMESIHKAPYLLPKMRDGARIGHQKVQDSMFLDGLEDAYEKGRLMGTFAEDCAEKYQFSRKSQDLYA